MKLSWRTIGWVILFSVAMGYLEAAVVVYLREIYYPSGFGFPLTPIPLAGIKTELLREASTLIMLVGIGVLSGRTRLQRLAFFLMAFGIWDITYYLFLKMILNWPPGLLTWDILFLIPIPWVGPVLAPCLLSLTMIFLAIVLLKLEKRASPIISFRILKWFILGSLIVIASFCEDPIRHLYLLIGENPSYIPSKFPWWLFALGEVVIIFGIIRIIRPGLHKRIVSRKTVSSNLLKTSENKSRSKQQ